MTFLDLLLDVILALAAALGLGLLLARLRQSAIIGYLLAGVLMGPGALGLIRGVGEVRLLAEIGVALLLFTIGLEFSWARLRGLGRAAILGGGAQILVTGLVAGGLGVWLAGDAAEGAIIGMIVAFSSTAVVFRVLADRASIDSAGGRVLVGILLMQDLAVVPLLVLIPVLFGAHEGSVGAELVGAGLRAIVLVVGIAVVARWVVPGLLRAAAATRSRELFAILALTFCLAATWVAHAGELSPVLGAFLAGVALAGSPFAAQIRADVGPLRAGFVALFFVSIGMFADPVWIVRNLPVVIGLVLAIVAGKAAIAGGAVRALGYPGRVALVAGLGLAHIGELSFVVADVARSADAIGPELFRLVISVSVITLLVTPYLIDGGFRVAAGTAERDGDGGPESEEELGALRKHVIVVGFGPTARRVVSALDDVGTPCVVIELNPQTVDTARRAGVSIEYGDATRETILEEAGVERAIGLIVTIPDPEACAAVISAARALRRDLPIVTRARYALYASSLGRAGADAVLNEEELMGERLASVALRLVGVASDGLARIRSEGTVESKPPGND